jgi:predicted NAD/FAD-dependent oxidoreductase
LLGDHAFAAEAGSISMQPCWAVLAAFDRRIEAEWDGAFVLNSPLAWVARNSSKPGRAASPDCWVLHATPDWSVARLNITRDQVMTALLGEFTRITSAPPPPTIHLDAHRWLFAATPLSLDRLSLWDAGTGLAVCGDWLAGGRVEGAFRSGVAAAGCILRQVGIPSEPTVQPASPNHDTQHGESHATPRLP